MADDGFREIQLSGKQLAALFMGAAVVLVVTFLCGVLVGRGVRSQKEPTASADASVAGSAATVDPTATGNTVQPLSAAPAGQPPATPPPTLPAEELSYQDRLESGGKSGGSAKTTAAKDEKTSKAGVEAKEAKAKPLPPQPAAAPAAAASSAPGEPAGTGLALRVAAFKDRAQADGLSGKLAGKGYSTYVVQLPATSKGPGLFSVRVGKFKTRKEADAVRRRLEKEEQLKPSLIAR